MALLQAKRGRQHRDGSGGGQSVVRGRLEGGEGKEKKAARSCRHTYLQSVFVFMYLSTYGYIAVPTRML